MTNRPGCGIIIPERERYERRKKMVYDYYEVYEAQYLAEQEAQEWLLFEADMATDPYAE